MSGTTMPEDTGTYYGRPVLKEPVWEPTIAAYLFTGGLAGASAGLSLAARLAGQDELARRCSLAATCAAAVSPPLLIEDLGRPDRFHHMLRVFKVTSPMNVGTWILSAFGAASGLASASEVTGRLKPAGRAAEGAAAALGMPLATYTAALLANTSIPAWHGARRVMPFVFAASSAATAGAMGSLLTGGDEGRMAKYLAIGGAVAEVGLSQLMERRLGDAGAPYGEGRSGLCMRAAAGCTLGGAAALAAGRASRALEVAGAALVLGGGLLERVGIWAAGRASARRTVR